MELTVRDWMVIVGVLLIVAVLIDAWRRVRADRALHERLSASRSGGAGDQDEHPSVLSELPNGGARVFRREDLMRATRDHAADAAPARSVAAPVAVSAEAPAAPLSAAAASPAPASTEAPETPARPAKPARKARAKQPARARGRTDGLFSGLRGEREEPANLDWLQDLPPEPPVQEHEEEGRLPRDADPEVFMLHVVADDPSGFSGEDIMQILLACDLRFGDMDFFHRHELEAGRGPIQFSVANMMQPGVFDIDRMAELRTPGLLFFVTLPGPEDMMKAFDYMLETAQVVARNLGGQVLDESRSAVTRQSLEHSRQQIRELERRMLARAR